MRRLSLTPLAVLAAAMLAAACGERSATGVPAGQSPGPEFARYTCTVTVSPGTMECRSANVRGAIIGNQGQNVLLTSSNVTWDEATRTVSAFVTVKNLLPYPIGTADGLNPDSGAVKVFFVSGPTTVDGSGDVTVANADGYGTFTASSQPFFRYAQKLNPGGVSSPREWRFQLDPEVIKFQFSVFVYAATQPAAVRIEQPAAGDSVRSETLFVSVAAQEGPNLTRVRAQVHDHSVLLAYENGRWSGNLMLGGLQIGSYTLAVTAIAPGGDSLTVNRYIWYDPRPDIVLDLPLNGTVARSNLRIAGKGTCHTTGCTVRVYWDLDQSPEISRRTSATFDTTVSMAAYDGQMGSAGARAIMTVSGRAPYTVSAGARIWVEASPRLAEVAAAGYQVLAVDSSHVFYRDTSAALKLLHYTAGDAVPVRVGANASRVLHAYLTPTGVIFSVDLGTTSGEEIYEYANGRLMDLAHAVRNSLHANGRWATWANYEVAGELYRRDVVEGTTVAIPHTGGAPFVGPNGDVVFATTAAGNGGIWRFRDGGVTQLATRGALPRTDGTLVAWGDTGKVVVNLGTRDTTFVAKSTGYDVANGWVVVTLTSGRLVSRAPDGFLRYASPGAVDELQALGPNGEVVFVVGTRRNYAAAPYAAPVDVGRNWSYYNNQVGADYDVRFSGGTAYTFIGRSAFRIAP